MTTFESGNRRHGKKNVLVFGNRDTAELAHYYLTNDSDHKVAAFCVHGRYCDSDKFAGLPLVAFEEVDKYFSTDEHCFIAPMTARNMNRDRESVFNAIRDQGYSFTRYVSSRATVLTDRIGDNCFILEDNTLQPFTRIGDNCVLWSGNHIGHHSVVDDHVFVSSHVVISGNCHIHRYSYLGVNATVSNNVDVAEGTLVGMNCSIDRSTDPWSTYHGKSARKSSIPSTEVGL